MCEMHVCMNIYMSSMCICSCAFMSICNYICTICICMQYMSECKCMCAPYVYLCAIHGTYICVCVCICVLYISVVNEICMCMHA